MARRAAAGAGTIRKKTVTKDGKAYTYWEARYTAGYDPGTGKQIQKSITGKTQKEVREKLQAVSVDLNEGSYTEPSKMTVGKWLDIWAAEYLGSVKPLTVSAYQATIKNYLKPGLGAMKLDALATHTIQSFYNSLGKSTKNQKALSPKTIKNIHGILHKALQQAVSNGYIRFNPTDACILPRIEKKELKPLDEIQTAQFMEAIKGHPFELLYSVALFTGMREGEILGLTWDCVNFKKGTILVNKQLQKERKKDGVYYLAPLKNDKPRQLTAAPFVMKMLLQQKFQQEQLMAQHQDIWSNSYNFVFTNELGNHLIPWTVIRHYKTIVASIGRPDARFHDLRHSYAVAAIRSGDDIKTVQGNLGHATASFTLDQYGHVTEQMKDASAARMEQYIKRILA